MHVCVYGVKFLVSLLQPEYSFRGFEWIFIKLLESAAFSILTPDIRKQTQTALTLFPLGYFEDLSPLGGGGGLIWPPPQISATNEPIDSKIGTVVKQVK